MSDTENGSPFGKFADIVRKQLHDHDIRLTRMESRDMYKKNYGDLFWKIVGVILVAGALTVSIVALLHTINVTP